MVSKIWFGTLSVFLQLALAFVEVADFRSSYLPDTSTNEENVRRISPLTNTVESIVADSMPVALKTYYQYINLAARAIYDNHFELASEHYDSAFVYYKYPFFEDLKNYTLLNAKCGFSTKNDVPLYHFIIDKKVDTAQLFLHLPRRIFSKENLATINKLVKTQKRAKIQEASLHKSLREMFAIDQAIRDYEMMSKMDYEARKAMFARRDSVDLDNAIRFEQLYNQYGFPGEETLGVFFDTDHQWSEVVYILLRHFVQRKDQETNVKVFAILRKALYAGQLHPSLFASLVELMDDHTMTPNPRFNFMNTTINLVLSEVYRPFVFYTDSLMKEVNTNRVAIGLDSFHITQRQVVCQYMGTKDLGEKKFIKMVQYVQIDEPPPGLVKKACDEANIDMHSYKINTTKIVDQCRCEDKVLR